MVRIHWDGRETVLKPYDANDGREDMFSQDFRVLRGGSSSFRTDRSYLRTSARDWNDPLHSDFDIGFRCARDVP
ncbi:MAG: SUMF1/EgtB/PvdO family nonheme iron enzyme [Anaerolineales bacterium]|nr:SUMF1/EgtB/PvdO family nonheme iron enzyme [Anaerolineales bacterium]